MHHRFPFKCDWFVYENERGSALNVKESQYLNYANHAGIASCKQSLTLARLKCTMAWSLFNSSIRTNLEFVLEITSGRIRKPQPSAFVWLIFILLKRLHASDPNWCVAHQKWIPSDMLIFWLETLNVTTSKKMTDTCNEKKTNENEIEKENNQTLVQSLKPFAAFRPNHSFVHCFNENLFLWFTLFMFFRLDLELD